MFIALQMNTFVVQQPSDQELVGGWRGLRRESDHAGHKLAQHSALSTHSRTLRGGWCATALVYFNTHPPLRSGTPHLSGIIYSEIKLQHTHLFVAGKTTKPVTAVTSLDTGTLVHKDHFDCCDMLCWTTGFYPFLKFSNCWHSLERSSILLFLCWFSY